GGVLVLFLLCALAVRVEVRSAAGPVADAQVTAGASSARTAARTDDRGVASLDISGDAEIRVEKPGYFPATVSVQAGQLELLVELQPVPSLEEQVTVSATRTNRRI